MLPSTSRPQERAEEELRRRVAFDDLIRRTFTSFMEIAPDDSTSPEQFDAAILVALAEVGRFWGAARSYILERSDDETALSTTYEWCAEGMPPRPSRASGSSNGSGAVGDRADRRGRCGASPGHDDIPPDIASQLALIGCVGVHSMVMLPVLTQGGVVGVVGLDWTRPSSGLESRKRSHS